MSLLQMSFAGAVMILAITIIRALAISLLPKKTFLALWGIAVARLLLPFSLPSMFSIYSLIGNQTSGIAATKVPQIDKVLPINTIGQMATMPGDIGSTTSTVSIWGAVWAAGTLVCAMVFAIAYWKCRQEFQTSLPVKNDFIKSWLNAHQLKRPISIRQSSRFSAPLTYGVFRPVILMPISTDWENTKALQYVLAHEYVHIRRFDSITKLVLIAALCVHWFNPLVWVMYILANRDIELSCDEAVVRLFGETTKAAYARALISMEETRSGLTPLCNNFSKNAIEERITAIMKIKKASIFSLVLALALVVGVTTAFATSAGISDNPPLQGEFPMDELDLKVGDVGDEIDGVQIIEGGAHGQYMDIDGLNLTFGTVGDEIGGVKIIENNSRFGNLADMEYIEGGVGTAAYGLEIIETPPEHINLPEN